MKKTIKQNKHVQFISGVLMIAVKLPSCSCDLKGRGRGPPNSVV